MSAIKNYFHNMAIVVAGIADRVIADPNIESSWHEVMNRVIDSPDLPTTKHGTIDWCLDELTKHWEGILLFIDEGELVQFNKELD